MARLPRLTLPGYPHHVIQRGNNRQPIFVTSADRQVLLDLLFDNAKKFEVAIHAYVLMGNHFHLLATPQTLDGLPLMMQAVGRRYVRYFNDTQQRSGTLWEGRYKACLVDSSDYLLRCVRYIDLNPVRARMTEDPTAFAWSSCAGLCGLRDDALLTPHSVQRTLGSAGYRAMLAEAISDEDLAAIRLYLQQQRAYGRDDFRSMVEAKTRRFAGVRPAHRPAKAKSNIETG